MIDVNFGIVAVVCLCIAFGLVMRCFRGDVHPILILLFVILSFLSDFIYNTGYTLNI